MKLLTFPAESLMEGNRQKLGAHVLCALVLMLLWSQGPSSLAQENPAQEVGPQSDPAATLTGEALVEHLKLQMDRLDSEEFRERELASFRLAQHPEAVIKMIAESAPSATINSAALQIALLDQFLTNPDTTIKTAAFNTLKKFSLTKTTAIAGLAASSVKGIEDEYERQAYEILLHAGARIGDLDIAVNGSKPTIRGMDFYGLEIKEGTFTGDSKTLSWVRHLKRIELVSLEGDVITPELLAVVAEMPQVKKILLRGRVVRPGVYSPMLKPEDFLVFQKVPEIEHFEVNYLPINDAFVPVLCLLPITESIRLFGTAISPTGKEEIERRLDGLEIYRGNGGFLGISSLANGPVIVNQVTNQSAAENAGILIGDTITEIQGETIVNFSGLRKTIAKYSPGEMLLVKVKRPRWVPDSKARMGKRIDGYYELQLFVVLNEQVN